MSRDITYDIVTEKFHVRKRRPFIAQPWEWRSIEHIFFGIKDSIDYSHLEVILNSPQILRLLPLYVKLILEDGLIAFNPKTSDLGVLAKDFETLIYVLSYVCKPKFKELCVEEEVVDAPVDVAVDMAERFSHECQEVAFGCKNEKFWKYRELELPF